MSFQNIEVGMTGAQFIDAINGNNEIAKSEFNNMKNELLKRLIANNIKQVRYQDGNFEFTLDGEKWIVVNQNAWGSLTGNLEEQADLMKVLNDKATNKDIESVNKALESVENTVKGNSTSISTLSKTTSQQTKDIGDLQKSISDKVSSPTIVGFRISASGYLEYTLDGVAWVPVSSIAEINWGSIGGEISNQQDLFKELKSKVNESDFNTHKNSKENPHSVTKEQIGLSDVDNTSDEDKPISKLQRDEFDKISKEVTNLDKNKLGKSEDVTGVVYCTLEEYNTMKAEGTLVDTVLYFVN